MSDFISEEAREFRNFLQATAWQAAMQAVVNPELARSFNNLPDTAESIEQKFGTDARKVWEEMHEVLRRSAKVGGRLRKGRPEALSQPTEVQAVLDQKLSPLEDLRSRTGEGISMAPEDIDDLVADIDALERRLANAEAKANRASAVADYVDRNRRKGYQEGNSSGGSAERLNQNSIKVGYVRWGTKYSFVAHEPQGHYPMTPETIDLLVSVHEKARAEIGFPVPQPVKLPWKQSDDDHAALRAEIGDVRYGVSQHPSGEWFWTDFVTGQTGQKVSTSQRAQEGAENHLLRRVRSMIDFRNGSDIAPEEDPGYLLPDEIELYRLIREASPAKEMVLARAVSDALEPTRRILRNLLASHEAATVPAGTES